MCLPEPDVRHRIVVIDSTPLWTLGMSCLVGREPDLVVSGHVTGPDGLGEIARARPHLVTMEISVRPRAGLRLIRAIRASYPEVPILVISMHDPARYAARALRAGARGYVMKTEPTGGVLEAIRAVLRGEVYVRRPADLPTVSA